MGKINTFTKHKIDPCQPHKEDIYIEDIAHALSFLCRSGGHFPCFYSVGQHSIACAKEARARGLGEKVQLACLLHDASEAYIADITRPVKEKLSEYLKYEKLLQDKIFEKYLPEPLTESEKELVSEIDDAMLNYEFGELMGISLFEKEPKLLTKPSLEFHGFKVVEKEFLEIVRNLLFAIN